ncbi:MAG TPA: flavin reductase family protein [Microlunatus sp.]
MTTLSETDTGQTDQLKHVMRQHATGVAIITTNAPDPVGFCANSLTSLSLHPPLVSFAVTTDSRSGRAWHSSTHGVVHLLHVGQGQLARRFARPGSNKFSRRTSWHRGPRGLPVLDDVLAQLLIEVWSRVQVGDHTLVIAEVLSGEVAGQRVPLLYHDGCFAAPAPLSTPTDVSAAEGRRRPTTTAVVARDADTHPYRGQP